MQATVNIYLKAGKGTSGRARLFGRLKKLKKIFFFSPPYDEVSQQVFFFQRNSAKAKINIYRSKFLLFIIL